MAANVLICYISPSLKTTVCRCGRKKPAAFTDNSRTVSTIATPCFSCALSALNQGTPCPSLKSDFLRTLEFHEGIHGLPRNADKILGHCSCCRSYSVELKVKKVKQSRYRPAVAQRVPGSEGSQIS